MKTKLTRGTASEQGEQGKDMQFLFLTILTL